MDKHTPQRNTSSKPADAAKAARLKAALKANIAKRKEQARARTGRQPPEQTEQPEG